MSIKKIIIAIVIIVILGVGYYAVLPVFNVIERDDPLPENPAPAGVGAGSGAESSAGIPQQEVPGFPVVETFGHPASGFVKVIARPEGAIIRYEDFETINGPDLRVYLSTDLDATAFVDLGKIKGTRGNINYEVPTGVNVADYNYVLVWCKPFGVLFNYAEL